MKKFLLIISLCLTINSQTITYDPATVSDTVLSFVHMYPTVTGTIDSVTSEPHLGPIGLYLSASGDSMGLIYQYPDSIITSASYKIIGHYSGSRVCSTTITLTFVEGDQIDGDTIFVDTAISVSDPTGCNDYDIVTRSSGEGAYRAFPTLQQAVDSMADGNNIYLRSGNHYADADDSIISIPLSKNGTPGNWCSIMSWPWEWAVLDFKGQTSSAGMNQGMGLGWPGLSSFDEELHYWKFERFEIKDARSADETQAVGLYVNGGPFVVRYLYIHGSYKADGDNNPNGLRMYRPHNSIIEWCRFYNNGGPGGSANQSHITFFSDYNWNGWLAGTGDLNHASRRNEIRYCYFDSSSTAMFHKGPQVLQQLWDKSSKQYSYFGDRWHHNYVTRCGQIVAAQDFCELSNNIFDGCYVIIGEYCSACVIRGRMSVFNNTLTNGRISLPFQYGTPPDTLHPYYFCVNNIIDSGASEWDEGILSIGLVRTVDQAIEFDDLVCERNLIHSPTDVNHFAAGSHSTNSCSEFLTETKFDSCYSRHNFQNTSSGLFTEGFLTDPDFVLNGDTIVSNGGFGGAHPLRLGMTIPTYVGAINSSDYQWYTNVLDLVNLDADWQPSGSSASQYDTVGIFAVSDTGYLSKSGKTYWKKITSFFSSWSGKIKCYLKHDGNYIDSTKVLANTDIDSVTNNGIGTSVNDSIKCRTCRSTEE